jgi:hypothetical protein
MRMKRKKDRRAAGQEAPMVITPRMVARLVGQIITSLRGIAKKARQH